MARITFTGIFLFGSLLAYTWTTVDAGITCYQCSNVELSTDSAAIRGLIGGDWKSDPSCESSPSQYTTCPSGNICGYMDSSGTTSLPLVGSFTARFIWRGCVPRSEMVSDQCVSVNQNIKDIVEITGEIQVDGQICSCTYDMCDAGCTGFNIRIAGRCLSWWIFVGAGGGLLILLISCCCCCCCSCCRRKPAPNYITLREEPRTVVVTNTHLQPTASPMAGADLQSFPPSYNHATSVSKGNII